MTQLDPAEPVSHYNLGLLSQRGPSVGPEAFRQFEMAAKLDVKLVASALPDLQRPTAWPARTRRPRRLWEVVKDAQAGEQKEADDTEDMEWSFYAQLS